MLGGNCPILDEGWDDAHPAYLSLDDVLHLQESPDAVWRSEFCELDQLPTDSDKVRAEIEAFRLAEVRGVKSVSRRSLKEKQKNHEARIAAALIEEKIRAFELEQASIDEGFAPLQPSGQRWLEMAVEVAWYPHGNLSIATRTVNDFVDYNGVDDAKKRGIRPDEWLWKRSRYLAGHH